MLLACYILKTCSELINAQRCLCSEHAGWIMVKLYCVLLCWRCCALRQPPSRCELTLGLMFICARHPSLTLLLLSQKANRCSSLACCERDRNSASNTWNCVHNCLLWIQALLSHTLQMIWFYMKPWCSREKKIIPVIYSYLFCSKLAWISFVEQKRRNTEEYPGRSFPCNYNE